jgi:tetratricopeptide (TPR) repeat protein
MKDMRNGLRDLATIEQRGFEQLSSAVSRVSEELSNLASIMEWGFEGLKWELQQQTDVLLSIDHTLKNPSQTQAHEWRRMAEELRERGCLNEAAEWFQKALKADPLDYRAYVGFAMTCLQGNNFDKARELLEKSLPHAPEGTLGPTHESRKSRYNRLMAKYKSGQELGGADAKDLADMIGVDLERQEEPVRQVRFDYKSLSHRLIGRTYACKGDFERAASSLRSAIDFSPDYEEGSYEYAQYCVQSGDRQKWSDPLRKAILAKPVYWYMARAERHFAPVRQELAKLLAGIRNEARERAMRAVAQAEQDLYGAAAETQHPRGDSRGSVALDDFFAAAQPSQGESAQLPPCYNDAANTLACAKRDADSGDYRTILLVPAMASEATRAARQVRQQVVSERMQQDAAARAKEAGARAARSLACRKKADTAIMLALGGLLCFLPLAPAGLIVGIQSLNEFSNAQDQQGKSKAVVAVVIGALGSLILVVIFLYAFASGIAASSH